MIDGVVFTVSGADEEVVLPQAFVITTSYDPASPPAEGFNVSVREVAPEIFPPFARFTPPLRH